LPQADRFETRFFRLRGVLIAKEKRFAMASSDVSPRYRPGDRVRVDSAVATTPALPGYVGIVKEVVASYADNTIGYNVSLEDDPRSARIWFFLQDQLRPA
jgi:hypothetical protein